MKRISFLLVTLALCAASGFARPGRGDAKNGLNKLSGRIDDLTAAQEALKKQIDELAKELESVREQSGKPNASYARPEDLNRLAEAIKEVDRKRMDDAEKIHTELLKLRELLKAPLAPPKKTSASLPKDKPVTTSPATPDKGFEYVINRATRSMPSCRRTKRRTSR